MKQITHFFGRWEPDFKFNQEAWLKPYINTNADLEKKLKIILEKTFLS